MRTILALLILLILIAGCQPSANDSNQTLPTLAVLPSLTPTLSDQGGATVTVESPTIQVSEETPEVMPTVELTNTSAPTITPLPAATQTLTEATIVVAATATIGVQEAPRIATLTAVPAGVNAPVMTTPQVLADVVITETQFQDELDSQIEAFDSIQSARIDFLETGISVELTALGGDAFITGNVFLAMEMNGNFLAISPVEIAVNAPEPPASFVETVNGDFLTTVLATLETVLTQRVGPDHDLQRVVLTPTQMEINLLVPQR
jgi:hypothetical protein